MRLNTELHVWTWSESTDSVTHDVNFLIDMPFVQRQRVNSRFSPVMWSKLKIVTIPWINSRIWDTIDDWYINNIAKNQVFADFHSRVICKSVSPKFRELCMETPCLSPSEGHKCGGRKVTETSVTEFCYRNEKIIALESLCIAINASSRASTV